MARHTERLKRYVNTEPPSFWDKEKNCPKNWSDEERLYRSYQKACKTVSVSGVTLMVLGILTAVFGALLSLFLGLGLVFAVVCLGSGASMAAIGSIASSNKKAAKLAEFTAWSAIK